MIVVSLSTSEIIPPTCPLMLSLVPVMSSRTSFVVRISDLIDSSSPVISDWTLAMSEIVELADLSPDSIDSIWFVASLMCSVRIVSCCLYLPDSLHELIPKVITRTIRTQGRIFSNIFHNFSKNVLKSTKRNFSYKEVSENNVSRKY